MGGGLEFQQNLSTLPIAVLVLEAESNRMEHLEPLVLELLKKLSHVTPRTLGRVRRAQ